MRVVLASASPRRKELLSLLVRDFECAPTNIDESARDNERPAMYVSRLAREKAQASLVNDGLVIAADTTVALGDIILGKPSDHAHAQSMLSRLSGKTHQVHTAVAVRMGEQIQQRCVSTSVRFATLSTELIGRYLDTDEPWDKAGAYGIQGLAGSFVESIEGSYSAVVGLPLAETRMLLGDFGCLPDWRVTSDG